MSEIIGILNAEDSINAILTPEDGMIGTLGYCGEQGPKGDKGDPGEDGSIVSVSATGTATDTVQYITIDGVEKKLAGGDNTVIIDLQTTFSEIDAIYQSGKKIVLKDGTLLLPLNRIVQNYSYEFTNGTLDDNETTMWLNSYKCRNTTVGSQWRILGIPYRRVYVSSTGTSTNTVNYITVGNTEYRFPTGQVFKAVYGVTTFNELLTAWNSNNVIMIQHDIGGSLGRVTGYASSHAWEGHPLTEKIRFRLNGFNDDTRISCDANNNWRDDDIV